VRIATQNEVGADFAEYVKATKSGPVVVTSKGKPVAVLLRSESDEDLERLLMGHSPKLQSILETARKRFRAGRGIPHQTFWKEMAAESVGNHAKASRAVKKGRTKRCT
jgi:prevent-host-death family protein